MKLPVVTDNDVPLIVYPVASNCRLEAEMAPPLPVLSIVTTPPVPPKTAAKPLVQATFAAPLHQLTVVPPSLIQVPVPPAGPPLVAPSHSNARATLGSPIAMATAAARNNFDLRPPEILRGFID